MPLPFKTQRKLKVAVDEARRAKLAEEAAVHNARLRKLERDEADLKSRLKAVKESIDEEVQAIAGKLDIVTAGVEEKTIDCEWREHPERPMKQLWRLDTAEVIEEKPLDADEAQRVIPGAESQAADEEGGDDAPTPEAPEEKKGREVLCPFILETPLEDDARQDVLCGAPGVFRLRGFCKQHSEETGGNHDSRQVRHLARRTARQKAWREEQEAEAAQLEQAEAQGSA